MRQASRLLSDEGKGVEDRRPRSLWVCTAGLAALLLVGIASVLAMSPTATAGSDAPDEAFSAARAMTHISAIADDPRPVGSAQHGEAKAYLLDQLGSLGWRTEVQESIGMFDFGGDGTQSIAAVGNVIATKPGTASTGTVVLTAHYDTVAGSPGAGDDGIGVGVLLETARALGTAAAPRNTVMILLTDAEEPGLLGAAAFVRERAKELGTAVVLNHEARGAGGAPMTFRMSSPNSELLEVLAGRRARSQTRARRRPSRRCRTTPTSPRSSRRGCTATTPPSWRTAPTITARSTTQPTSVRPPCNKWVTPPLL